MKANHNYFSGIACSLPVGLNISNSKNESKSQLQSKMKYNMERWVKYQ
ncbi:hypothetical protein GO621_09465 [Mucilaginibacter sp. HMF7410]|uniref:Uncharacterized protein n=1 Tax=Mucilaginibacter arboris TaxID=2682090 RepID=A0A7K1SWT9_9SPHI|nr:hypothetical protein [Mucilaginibacter arboris]MVN21764.1 hypothetical protein [Mucilaginibacter arboris]